MLVKRLWFSGRISWESKKSNGKFLQNYFDGCERRILAFSALKGPTLREHEYAFYNANFK